MIDKDICPYGLLESKTACSNRMHCLTTGEPKCMNFLGSGETVEQYLRKHRLWKDDNQK